MSATKTASMASNSPPSPNTTIAWATAVDPFYLNARLFAYVSTKAIISTFRFAMKHSPLQACRSMSAELLLMIADHVRETCFLPQLEKWDRLSVFLTENSYIWTKSSREAVDAVINEGAQPVNLDHLSMGYYGEVSKIHREDVQRYHQILTRINGASKFARCAEIFAQDFGIRPYCFVGRVYRNVGIDKAYAIGKTSFRAYLTMPMQKPSDSDEPPAQPNPEQVSLAIDTFADPSLFIRSMKSMTEDQRRRYHSAANVLGTQPSNAIQQMLNDFVRDTRPDPAPIGDTSHGGSKAAESNAGHGIGGTKTEDIQYDPTIRMYSYAPKDDSSLIPEVQQSSTADDAELGKSGNIAQEEFLIVESVFREYPF